LFRSKHLHSQIESNYATALSGKRHCRSCVPWQKRLYAADMATLPKHCISVIFIAQRTLEDDSGYTDAAEAMDALAALQPGYLGMDSVRGADGLGITISYWASDNDAKAWRDQPGHAKIREQGRNLWYSSYSLHVASVERSYDWTKS
jgi:heme-degrading monooxygenase HmoA